jgi:hypothetical protein
MIGIEFTGVEQVTMRLLQYEKDQRERAKLACAEVARLLETYAIMHHKWVPRTWATNVTTKGTWQEAADGLYEIVLSAGMSYDVFLEHGARQYAALTGEGGVPQTVWSWLWPALLENRDAILQTFARHLAH